MQTLQFPNIEKKVSYQCQFHMSNIFVLCPPPGDIAVQCSAVPLPGGSANKIYHFSAGYNTTHGITELFNIFANSKEESSPLQDHKEHCPLQIHHWLPCKMKTITITINIIVILTISNSPSPATSSSLSSSFAN